MNKIVVIMAILSLTLLVSVVLAPMAYATTYPILSTIQRPLDFYEETIEGGNPQTVDYSWAYDTASGQLIMNTMDTLIMFNGEHTDQFLPGIATSWTITNLGAGIDSGDPINGLIFENANQSGVNATYYYKYDFVIRPYVYFQPPWNYSLTPADVVYSFQRTIVMDRDSGPQWMLEEPLLDINAGQINQGTYGEGADLTNSTQVAEMGALIRDSVRVGPSGNDVVFYLMFPGAYAPFLQILSQTWSSIESKQWVNNQVITGAGRPDWNGNWGTLTAWTTNWNPTISPLDDPTPMEYGSGPYILTYYNWVTEWDAVRYENYWGGWPATYPSLGVPPSVPAGFADTIEVTWKFAYATRLIDFKSGVADFAALPSDAYIPDLYPPGTLPPYTPPKYPLDGLRDIQPLPLAWVHACFFTFNINSATVYGPIGPADTFGNSLIPSDFFGNAKWGIKVRQAFAQAFDYNTFLANLWSGEASHPATAIVPGLNYYDPSVTGYSYSLAAANASFNLVGPDSNGKMLKDVGFTITLLSYYNRAWMQSAFMLKSAIESLNPLYHVNAVFIRYSDYLQAAAVQKLPMFMISWMADFPDPNDFAMPFYRTGREYAAWQAYSNPTMDALIDAGIATPDGPARAQIYHDIQVLAVQDCPSFTLDQPTGRHFERDWVVGWYYNVVYPGIYFYNLWKWNYSPEANDPAPSQPHSSNLPADVNYDGKVDIKDIKTVAAAFGTTYTITGIQPKWVYRGDVDNNRKIDIKDISYVAKLFGTKSPSWPLYLGSMNTTTQGLVTGPIHLAPGNSLTFYPLMQPQHPEWWPVIPIQSYCWQISDGPWPASLVGGVASTPTYTFTAPQTPGTYIVKVDIDYTVPFPAGPVKTTCCIPVYIIVP